MSALGYRYDECDLWSPSAIHQPSLAGDFIASSNTKDCSEVPQRVSVRTSTTGSPLLSVRCRCTLVLESLLDLGIGMEYSASAHLGL